MELTNINFGRILPEIFLEGCFPTFWALFFPHIEGKQCGGNIRKNIQSLKSERKRSALPIAGPNMILPNLGVLPLVCHGYNFWYSAVA